ncbi:hypothetical protein BC940DRAFT_312047 [Gongronella butleri]|nr:hypothetical protein BC940DRAFT_312047 [Gongronella butleri]
MLNLVAILRACFFFSGATESRLPAISSILFFCLFFTLRSMLAGHWVAHALVPRRFLSKSPRFGVPEASEAVSGSDDGNERVQESAVHRGRLFEHDTLKALAAIGMQLRHVGGKSDGGIDLKGLWPSVDDNVQVMIQCKNVKLGCQPEHLRGLLGATVSLNRGHPLLAMLVSASPKPFTQDTLALFGEAPFPLALARVHHAQLHALVLNPVAQQWLAIDIYPRFANGAPVYPPLIMTKDGRVV